MSPGGASDARQPAAAPEPAASWLVEPTTPPAGGLPAVVHWSASITLTSDQLAQGVTVTAFHAAPIIIGSNTSCSLLDCGQGVVGWLHGRGSITDAQLQGLFHTPLQYSRP